MTPTLFGSARHMFGRPSHMAAQAMLFHLFDRWVDRLNYSINTTRERTHYFILSIWQMGGQTTLFCWPSSLTLRKTHPTVNRRSSFGDATSLWPVSVHVPCALCCRLGTCALRSLLCCLCLAVSVLLSLSFCLCLSVFALLSVLCCPCLAFSTVFSLLSFLCPLLSSLFSMPCFLPCTLPGPFSFFSVPLLIKSAKVYLHFGEGPRWRQHQYPIARDDISTQLLGTA